MCAWGGGGGQRERDRQTDRQTDRDRDRETERETERQRERQRESRKLYTTCPSFQTLTLIKIRKSVSHTLFQTESQSNLKRTVWYTNFLIIRQNEDPLSSGPNRSANHTLKGGNSLSTQQKIKIIASLVFFLFDFYVCSLYCSLLKLLFGDVTLPELQKLAY